MKIVFFIDRMNGFGGAQRVISALANEFSKRGNEVALFLTGNTKDSVYPLEEGICIKTFYTEGAFHHIKSIKKIKREIGLFNPDVMVSFLTLVNIIAILSNFRRRFPLIISERNDPTKCSLYEKILSRFLYNKADAIVVQTKDIEQKIKDICHCKSFVIQNPLSEFSVAKDNYTSVGKIVAVGRLNKQKNYQNLILAMKIVVSKFPDYILDIYGVGPEKNNLKQIVRDQNLENNIYFKGNSDSIQQVEIKYDFYVMSSDFEGMPNALAEAMAIGMPCISTNCEGGGAASLICSGKNGLLVARNNPQELANAIIKFINNKDLREEMGTQAKQIRNTLSIDTVFNLWCNCIEDVV